MSQDNFERRRRPSLDGDNGAKEFDFSAIAQDAVARTHEQGDSSEPWNEDEAPVRKRPSRKPRPEKAGTGDPWDQPVSRQQVMAAEGENSPRRRPMSRRAASEEIRTDDTPKPKRKLSELVKLLPQTVTGKDSFDKTSDRASAYGGEAEKPLRRPERPSRRAASEKATDGQWDKPVDRASVMGDSEEQPRLKPLIRKREAKGANSAQTDGAPIRRRNAEEPARRAPSSQPALAVDDFDDEFDNITVEKPTAPPPPPAQPEPPKRRVFNAATQPNYAYMTDDTAPAEAAAPKNDSAASDGKSGGIRAALMKRFNQDEPGVEYYTPPANRAPSDVRRHQKRRNRRPWPSWLKYSVFGLCLALAFFAIVYAAFYIIITDRIDYVGDSTKNKVYLSSAEMVNLKADLTDTEENAAEFTEPLSFAEPREGVKVIMVVSSDSQLGSNGYKSAKTDAIMLVAIDNINRRIRIASIMTDTYVRIQNYQSNKLSKAYYYDTANGDYTLTTLKQAVKDNFGVTPDNYVIVDFDALQILVERINGVDIYVSADEAYYMSHHERYGDFPRYNSEGPYTMSGSEALNYVRMRAVGNGDYDRVARQRKVFSQILVKLQSKSMLELAELAYSILPELPTDMTAGDVFGYLTDARDISSYEVTEVTFPITNSWRYGTASVRDEADYIIADSVTDSTVSGSDLTGGTSAPVTDNKFTVIVTNFQFNATALQRYLYENDESYLNGAAAVGVAIPEIIAPLENDSPAASLDDAA